MALAAIMLALKNQAAAEEACAPAGLWTDPKDGRTIDHRALFQRTLGGRIVLLGEQHTSAEHHRWQLHTLAGLYAMSPGMAIGFEMFPRRVQPALDSWSRGEIGRTAFLEDSDWQNVWKVPAALYMPIFDFARMNRVPMIALNVERELVSRVGEEGWANIPEDEREGVSDPVPASDAYIDVLSKVYAEHVDEEKARGEQVDAAEGPDDPAFLRFVEAQLLWDRAMAEALAAAAASPDNPLVVGIIGEGHLARRHGVPRQLEALGYPASIVLLPWDSDRDCKLLVPGFADAVFGLDEPPDVEPPPPPRLGIMISAADGGVVVNRVLDDSVAAATDIREGDVITEAAGLTLSVPGDLVAVVNRQAPGTWLPLVIRRDDETLDVVAKFPPAE